MSDRQLRTYLQKFANRRIAVVGDLMLDIYHRGTVNRISPEAPVPVVSIDHIEHHPGGAANVAMNLRSLRAMVDMYGVVGDDNHGALLVGELRETGIGVGGVLSVASRPTTAKTRVIAGSQHVVRTDLEVTSPLDGSVAGQLIEAIGKNLPGYDAVILQDYNKGVLQPDVIQALVKECKKANVPVMVDPKFQNLLEYTGATLVKPNLKEVEQILARPVETEEEIREAGRELLERLQSDHLLITLGARGMVLFAPEETYDRLETQARHVADVSGAGDTVISTVTLAMSAGASAYEAAVMGNLAAGRVCEEVGIVPIAYEALQETLAGNASGV